MGVQPENFVVQVDSALRSLFKLHRLLDIILLMVI